MSLTYIETARPTAFLLENVLGILAIDDGAYFKKVLRRLHVSGSYAILHMVANSFNFGVAQSRRRVYIVGALRRAVKLDFVFPDGGGSKPQLCDFLDPRVSADDCKRMPGTSQINARAILQQEFGARMKAAGLDAAEPDRILDIDASLGWASGSRDACPCLTHSRPSGLWLVSRGMRLSADEMLRLQGICPEVMVDDRAPKAPKAHSSW